MDLSTHHNHDIEKGVLGRVIFEGEYLEVCDTLEPKHFNAPDHRDIYKAYQDLFLQFKKLPDMVDVIAAVREATGKNATTLLSACQQMGLSCWNVAEKAQMIEQLWMRRELQMLGKRLDTSPNKAQDLLEAATDTILEMKSGREAKATLPIGDIAKTDLENLNEGIRFARLGETVPGAILTGFKDIDESCGGWKPKEMVIIAARPGMGKTTLTKTIAKNAARNGVPVLFFSLDMPSRSVTRNMVADIANVDHSKLRTAMIDDIEYKRVIAAYKEVEGINIEMNETDFEVEQMWLTAKRWRIQNPNGPGLIFFDYVQKIHSRNINFSQMNASQTHVAFTLSRMAKELDVCVVPLSQLNRSVENRPDKRPMLSDLRDSGSWEQEAQTVLMPYRPEYYGFETDEEGNSTEGICELIRAKDRNNGGNKPIKLKFVGKYSRFEDWTGYDTSGFLPMSQFEKTPNIAFNHPIMPNGHAGF